jgi:formylglycine-generating enzyme required for sulfatase activity
MRYGLYEVEREIGRGGMGIVYRARASDGRLVAIKAMKRFASERARDRFQRERRLLARLGEHAGFVPLLDAGDAPEGPFLVMPFVSGGTLRNKLERGPLPIAEAVALGVALARALGAAHEVGVVHRDVKPENVLYDGARPLISDLGLAKHFDRDEHGGSASVSLSKTGDLLGTIGYMPPEQMTGAKEVGPEADVFALGAILHECLSGKPAFAGMSALELVARVEECRPAPLRSLRSDTPAWLELVVTRALAKEPGERFQDGHALADALVLEDGPAPARRVGTTLGVRKELLLGAALVAVIAFACALALLRPVTPSRPISVATLSPPVVTSPVTVHATAPLPPLPPRRAKAEYAPPRIEIHAPTPDFETDDDSIELAATAVSDAPVTSATLQTDAGDVVTATPSGFPRVSIVARVPLPSSERRVAIELRVRDSDGREGLARVRILHHSRPWLRYSLTVRLVSGSEIPVYVYKLPSSMQRLEFVRVPGGPFLSGADKRRTELDEFWIGRKDVTREQYAEFSRITGHAPPVRATWEGSSLGSLALHPVVGVTFADARAFAAWVGGALPTAAQWQKAARGTDGRTYPWGDEWDPSRCNACDDSLDDDFEVNGQTLDQFLRFLRPSLLSARIQRRLPVHVSRGDISERSVSLRSARHGRRRLAALRGWAWAGR